MKIIIGNLKMNILNAAERKKYLDWIKKEWSAKKAKDVEMVVCPPFLHLEAFRKELPKKVVLGAQDSFSEYKGSYTGEISPLMLKDMGVEYVILGHSERRRYFAESDEEISRKVASVLKAGLSPVLCVGESKVDREEGRMMEIIEKQLIEGLILSKKTLFERIVIAYEPIWSVGTDVVPASNEVMEAKLLIRKILVGTFGKKYGEMPRIVYGGSVNSRSAEALCVKSDMDGALVGRESLIPSEFMRIAEIISGK